MPSHMSRPTIACFAVILAAFLLLQTGVAQAQTIDYAFVSSHAYDNAPANVRQAVARQVWMFSHASVGANILDGMDTLHYDDPARYPLVRTEAGLDWLPGSPTPGAIYDIDRGNPEWDEKYALFRQAVTGPWQGKADFAMDKLCYIDQYADADAYLASMARTEAATKTRLVYTTMPLTTEADQENDMRNAYNAKVRAFAKANGKLLFDIADLEAHDSSGKEQTYAGGRQRLWSGWSDDGGHLDGRGQVWLAKAWYAMAAAVAATGGETRSEPMTIPGTNWTLGQDQ